MFARRWLSHVTETSEQTSFGTLETSFGTNGGAVHRPVGRAHGLTVIDLDQILSCHCTGVRWLYRHSSHKARSFRIAPAALPHHGRARRTKTCRQAPSSWHCSTSSSTSRANRYGIGPRTVWGAYLLLSAMVRDVSVAREYFFLVCVYSGLVMASCDAYHVGCRSSRDLWLLW